MTRTDEPHTLVHSGIPSDGTFGELLVWAIAHAALAPSEHNSQPWRFRLQGESDDEALVDLLLDDSRALPVVDPEGREARLACGAALLNLRLALVAAGCDVTVTTCPEPGRPELLATVHVLRRGEVDDTALRRAIPLRGTHRGPFEPTDVPMDVVEAIVHDASSEGAGVAVLTGTGRAAVVRLSAAADAHLWNDSAFRREAAAWGRAHDTGQRDGVPGYALGRGAVRSLLQPALGRAAGIPLRSASGAAAAAATAPALVVVWTDDDEPASVLRAGEAMERVLLGARAEHLAASFVNASLQVPDLRRLLGRLTGYPCPQVLIRLGYGDVVRPTPRRGVRELLLTTRGAT